MRPTSRRPEPLTPHALADRLAVLLAGLEPLPGAAALRVGVDGPPVAEPEVLAAAVAERLPPLGRPAVVVPAAGFYRPASVRLEHGRHDPDARYTDWLDTGALAREVLDRCGPGGPGDILPALWDVDRDRAVRAGYRPVAERSVLLVPGSLLEGAGLAFDLLVHLRVSAAARRRRTPAELAWELPAFDRYDEEVDPAAFADVVVLADHADRPALLLSDRFS
jgi:hypothetical protein